MADRREHAVATAQAYHQGNIAGLDDAMTRRLIASVVMTESNGGNLSVTNKQGYVGRYQAGAGWLADAGYIDKEKLQEAMKGSRSEWAWASKGGMTEFLNDPSNWKNGLSLEKYKGSAELQDNAFRINSDHAYKQALKNGVLHEDDKPEKIAGFLKARHIAGYGGAVAAITGGRVMRDSNGTSNYDYMHDITRNRDGLDQLMKRAPGQHTPEPARDSAPGVLKQGAHGAEVGKLQEELNRLGYDLKADKQFGPQTEAKLKAFQHDHGLKSDGQYGPQTKAALDRELKQHAERGDKQLGDQAHPAHGVFKQALDGVHKIDADRQRTPDQISQNVAGSLAVAAQRAGLSRIDHVLMSEDGSRVYAVQGDLNSPHKRMAEVPTQQAVNTSLEQSSREMAKLGEQHTASKQQTQTQTHEAQQAQATTPQHR
ncbi:peptidoglycan-binding protein [Dyella sp. LX-66]|uniref:peptidoglycan-binding domain-containing protein n=1 Tax=unclassified Dyella TaxID=2634549 RepID=UPI001BDF9B03|nr:MULTISPECIES: peptidoglycan-binding protein [unclassified Dyella]MBT2115657.1 peptidoglycan-binding protein [Dyella sp. LX-1]MBT2139472.1 peptidoglycan-binding protein [Dyella sp. LX-66]